MADRFITSDALTGIKVLLGIDYFSCSISRQKRARGMNLFVTRYRGSDPVRTIAKVGSGSTVI